MYPYQYSSSPHRCPITSCISGTSLPEPPSKTKHNCLLPLSPDCSTRGTLSPDCSVIRYTFLCPFYFRSFSKFVQCVATPKAAALYVYDLLCLLIPIMHRGRKRENPGNDFKANIHTLYLHISTNTRSGNDLRRNAKKQKW